MIRKSNYRKQELIQAIGGAVQSFQDATDAFDFKAAKAMGLNQTDLKCLTVIFARGPVAASEIAEASGLSRGAATTALDRIEKAGLAKRQRSTEDRRGVLLNKTPKAMKLAETIWGPNRDQGAEMLSRYLANELIAILRFLEEATALTRRRIAEM
jgi:DNA-binding MarR family transcriptional regulator